MNDDVTPKNVWDQSVNYIKKLKNLFTDFSLIRLENLTHPVLLIYWSVMITATFLQLKFKVTKSNKVKFSPHQISFHVKHPDNTFYRSRGPWFRGRETFPWFKNLGACSLWLGGKLDACCLGLEACRLMLQ